MPRADDEQANAGTRSDHPPGGTGSGEPSAPRAAEQGDLLLMRRVQAADAAALAALYDRYAPAVHGIARSVLRDHRLAEEATHDVFLGIWQRPNGYDPSRGPFGGWLLRVARNRSIDLLRRRREQPFAGVANDAGEVVDPVGWLVDPDPDPADQATSAVMGEAVRRGLATLSADHRRLLELAYFGGMTQREIALHLDRPLGTVKTQIRAAMRRLADVMRETTTADTPSRVSEEEVVDRRERVGVVAVHEPEQGASDVR